MYDGMLEDKSVIIKSVTVMSARTNIVKLVQSGPRSSRKTGKSFRRGYRGQTTTENLLRFFEKCTGQNIIGINIFPKFNYYMGQDLDVNIEEGWSPYSVSLDTLQL